MLNNDIDIVSPEEMKANFHLIRNHLPKFKGRFDKVLKEANGDISITDIDILIKDALEEGNLFASEKRILNGFYETWMSIF